MSGSQTRFLFAMTACAVVALVVQGLTHVHEGALFLTPLFVIVTLLLSGRFLGEERIVRRWSSFRRPRRRLRAASAAAPLAASRRRRLVFVAGTGEALLARTGLARRGPPAPRVVPD